MVWQWFSYGPNRMRHKNAWLGLGKDHIWGKVFARKVDTTSSSLQTLHYSFENRDVHFLWPKQPNYLATHLFQISKSLYINIIWTASLLQVILATTAGRCLSPSHNYSSWLATEFRAYSISFGSQAPIAKRVWDAHLLWHLWILNEQLGAENLILACAIT